VMGRSGLSGNGVIMVFVIMLVDRS
jgi:hypothetical protein